MHEFEVLVDDFLIYRGMLNKAPSSPQGSSAATLSADKDKASQPAGRIGKRGSRRRGAEKTADANAAAPLDFAQTILFTDDPDVCARERHHIFIPEAEDHCLFINENTVMASPGQQVSERAIRPTTSTGSRRL